MSPLDAPLQAVRDALEAQDLEAYALARDEFNETTAALIRELANRRE